MNSVAPLSFESIPPATAAEWYALRLQRQDAEVEEQFARWLEEDPQRSDEYAIYELARELSEAADMELPLEEPELRWYQRSSTIVTLISAALGGIALAAQLMLPPDMRPF